MPATTSGKLLIVDDEVELNRALCDSLADEGYETTSANSGAEGLQLLETRRFDMVLCDLMMPGMDGIEMLRKALEIEPALVGVIMTGQGTIATAVESMRTGAFDYILKPFNMATILPVIRRGLEVAHLRTQNVRLRRIVQNLAFESPRYQMVGEAPAMQKVLGLLEKVSPTNATVLIRGPSGTGKELVARAIHYNSLRREEPLVTINCAALQESLLESELFGHEKGAFTGAQHTKPGLIEVAEGGTLFVDEVAEMSPSLQAKLLRVLEDGHYRRVGGLREAHADVRIIAATNKPLEDEQKAGRFREDLFYRLNVVSVALPPLRDRREDIPALVGHLLTTRPVGNTPCRVAPEALRALVHYAWPGNIRELANVLERAQILAEDGVITMDDLPDAFRTAPPSMGVDPAGPLDLSSLERQATVAALEKAKGNKVHAAKLLGITRRSLYRLVEKYGLEQAVPPET